MTYQEVNVHTVNFIQDVNLDAPASDSQSSGAQGGGLLGGPFMLILVMLALMMIFMRPRQDKEGEKFRNALQKEQDVVTSSGIFGKVKDMDEVSVTLEIAQGMRIKVDKRYVNPVPTPQPAKPEKPSRRRKKDPSKDEKA
ncbi:MAG: preprotein translocase subunit YajC [Bacteroidaceae bacterium]|nr:preprotein translocase subunit YajC [Bacteroidaceae bacterium]